MKRLLTLMAVVFAVLLSITVVGAEEIEGAIDEDHSVSDEYTEEVDQGGTESGADDAEQPSDTVEDPEAPDDSDATVEDDTIPDGELADDEATDIVTGGETTDENAPILDEEQGTASPDAEINADSLTGTNDNKNVFSSFADKVMEFVEIHKDTIIMIVGFVASIFIAVSEKLVRRKISRENNESQSVIIGDLEGVKNTQNLMIDGYNALSEAYNAMKEKYAEYENIEDDRNKLVGAVLVQQATLLEIITSVYANSSGLPQGEKDLILYKYSKCLSTLDNDKKLAACVQLVRDALNKEDNKEN